MTKRVYTPKYIKKRNAYVCTTKESTRIFIEAIPIIALS